MSLDPIGYKGEVGEHDLRDSGIRNRRDIQAAGELHLDGIVKSHGQSNHVLMNDQRQISGKGMWSGRNEDNPEPTDR